MEEIFAEDVDYGLPWCRRTWASRRGSTAATTPLRSSASGRVVEPENIHDVRIHTFHDDPNELLAEYSVDTTAA